MGFLADELKQQLIKRRFKTIKAQYNALPDRKLLSEQSAKNDPEIYQNTVEQYQQFKIDFNEFLDQFADYTNNIFYKGLAKLLKFFLILWIRF